MEPTTINIEFELSSPQELAAEKISDTLIQNGYTAYFVGGYVRDKILGKSAKDIDIACSATPDEIEDLFDKTIAVGKSFGVMVVVQDGEMIELATFRKDGGYQDGRRPESIEFCGAYEDARRRDFTMNALFYDPQKKEIIDYVGGHADLLKGEINVIGKAEERFSEDYLRMLRAIRFSARFNFPIEEGAFQVICSNADFILKISNERIFNEINAMFCGPDPKFAIQLLKDAGFLKLIFNAGELADLGSFSSCDPETAWAVFFHSIDYNSEKAVEKLKELKVSNIMINAVKFCMEPVRLDDKADYLHLFSHKHFAKYLDFIRIASIKDKASKELFDELLQRYRSYGFPRELVKAFVSGDELQELGLQPGKEFGRIIKTLYRMQLNDELKTKEEALLFVKKEYF